MTDSTFRWAAIGLLAVIALSLYTLSGMAAMAALQRRLPAAPAEKEETT